MGTIILLPSFCRLDSDNATTSSVSSFVVLPIYKAIDFVIWRLLYHGFYDLLLV